MRPLGRHVAIIVATAIAVVLFGWLRGQWDPMEQGFWGFCVRPHRHDHGRGSVSGAVSTGLLSTSLA